jgi:hypothetical protein
MDAQQLQRIEQRIKEGYYQGDADTLSTMQELVAAIRRVREDESAPVEELS